MERLFNNLLFDKKKISINVYQEFSGNVHFFIDLFENR